MNQAQPRAGTRKGKRKKGEKGGNAPVSDLGIQGNVGQALARSQRASGGSHKAKEEGKESGKAGGYGAGGENFGFYSQIYKQEGGGGGEESDDKEWDSEEMPGSVFSEDDEDVQDAVGGLDGTEEPKKRKLPGKANVEVFKEVSLSDIQGNVGQALARSQRASGGNHNAKEEGKESGKAGGYGAGGEEGEGGEGGEGQKQGGGEEGEGGEGGEGQKQGGGEEGEDIPDTVPPGKEQDIEDQNRQQKKESQSAQKTKQAAEKASKAAEKMKKIEKIKKIKTYIKIGEIIAAIIGAITSSPIWLGLIVIIIVGIFVADSSFIEKLKVLYTALKYLIDVLI